MKALCFHGAKDERERLKTTEFARGSPSFDICVTTYDMLVCEILSLLFVICGNTSSLMKVLLSSSSFLSFLNYLKGHMVRHEETQVYLDNFKAHSVLRVCSH